MPDICRPNFDNYGDKTSKFFCDDNLNLTAYWVLAGRTSAVCAISAADTADTADTAGRCSLSRYCCRQFWRWRWYNMDKWFRTNSYTFWFVVHRHHHYVIIIITIIVTLIVVDKSITNSYHNRCHCFFSPSKKDLSN